MQTVSSMLVPLEQLRDSGRYGSCWPNFIAYRLSVVVVQVNNVTKVYDGLDVVTISIDFVV